MYVQLMMTLSIVSSVALACAQLHGLREGYSLCLRHSKHHLAGDVREQATLSEFFSNEAFDAVFKPVQETTPASANALTLAIFIESSFSNTDKSGLSPTIFHKSPSASAAGSRTSLAESSSNLTKISQMLINKHTLTQTSANVLISPFAGDWRKVLRQRTVQSATSVRTAGFLFPVAEATCSTISENVPW
jgi:hypothetical protein